LIPKQQQQAHIIISNGTDYTHDPFVRWKLVSTQCPRTGDQINKALVVNESHIV